MKKPLRYSIIGLSALFGGYVTYLIYSRLHTAMIDAKVTPYNEAIDKLNEAIK
jgi:hypothetical protein